MSLYITTDELKVTLELGDETYADDDIDLACSAASQAIEGYKNTRYYPTTATAVYTADRPPSGGTGYQFAYATCPELTIDDLNALTSLKVDEDGDGVYETAWTENTDFFLGPENAHFHGVPYNTVTIRRQSGRVFPPHQRAIQIIGSFGWADTPDRVKQAAKILAARYLKRARETPYGLIIVTGDAVAAARLGKIDPDVAALLDNQYARVPRPFV